MCHNWNQYLFLSKKPTPMSFIVKLPFGNGTTLKNTRQFFAAFLVAVSPLQSLSVVSSFFYFSPDVK